MRLLKPIILAGMLGVPFAAMAEERPQIAVSGEGVVHVVPDIATLSLGVTSEGRTAAEALSANSTALSAVMERLKAAGIADRDIQTSNLSVNPNWAGSDSSASQRIAGYTAANMVTVTVRDLKALGTVLDKAVADGANTLNGLSFGLADPKPALDQARKAAVADAIDRARLLSGAAGIGLGPVLSITEGGGYDAPAPMMRAMAKADSVPVAEGELDISANVTMIFELKQ